MLPSSGQLFCARQTQSPRQILQAKAKHFIRRNLCDPDLSIGHVAASLKCTKRYLHMAFAEEGLTIARYIWIERLEQCRRELASVHAGDVTVTGVAFAWGFKSSSHLSRAFRKAFGFPPSLLLRPGGAMPSGFEQDSTTP